MYVHAHSKKPTAAVQNTDIVVQQISTGMCVCTTQALEPCEGKSSWGRASYSQKKSHKEVVTQSSTTPTLPHSWAFASPVNTRYPLMLQLGSQMTPGYQVPNMQLGGLNYWSKVSKVLAQRNNIKLA